MAKRTAAPPPDLPARVPPDRFERNIAGIVDLTRELVARPMLLCMGAPVGGDACGEPLVALSRREAVPLVLYQATRMDIVDPTAEGYSQTADMIFGRLRLEGLVKEEDE